MRKNTSPSRPVADTCPKKKKTSEKEPLEKLIEAVKEGVNAMVRQKLITQKEANEILTPKPLTKERKRQLREYLGKNRKKEK